MAARALMPFLPATNWSPSGYLCGGYYLDLATGKPHTCVAEAAFGEGARTSNRLEFVSFRSERFTVDALGYRNPTLSMLKPRIILFGSSFSLGLSLNDEETFAARLNERLGPVVFNAARVLSLELSADPILRGAEAAGVRSGWVLLEMTGRTGYGYAGPKPPSRRERVNAMAPGIQVVRRMMVNPYALVQTASFINLRLQNDRVLPNPDRGVFVVQTLRGGRRILAYRDDVSFTENPVGTESTAESVNALARELTAHGFRLAVVLIPPAYSVYRPLLEREKTGDPGGDYAAELSERIAGFGVPVFNALPALRRAAVSELVNDRLVYWPDDAHWNPAGVRVVAGQVAPWLKGLPGILKDNDAVQ